MNKEELLSSLQKGTISREDVIDALVATESKEATEKQSLNFNSKPVSALMYVAGILLSSALIVFLFTVTGFSEDALYGGYYYEEISGLSGKALMNAIPLTLVAIALYVGAHLMREKLSRAKGVSGAMLLSGLVLIWYASLHYALSIAYSGLFMVTDERCGEVYTTGDGACSNYVNVEFLLLSTSFAIVLALFSLAIIAYGAFSRQNIATYGGIVGVSFALVTVSFSFIDEMLDYSFTYLQDLYMLVFIGIMCATAAYTRTLKTTWFTGYRDKLDYLAVLFSLITIWIGQFSSLDLIWLIVLIATSLFTLYLGVSKQSVAFIATASFFLAVAVFIIAFEFFGGHSTALALLISALGVAGIAVGFVYVSKNMAGISAKWKTRKKEAQLDKGATGISGNP